MPTEPFRAETRDKHLLTLAAVGIRDSSRKPLAESLLRLKREHFGDGVDGDWGDTEIKGRYLLHMSKYAGNGKQANTTPGWSAVATPTAVANLVGDIAKIFGMYRPLILTTVVDKRKMLARQRQPLNPIGIVYAYLQRNIALTLEHQHAGEAAVVVADQQGQHESFFRSGGIHGIRAELSAAHLRQPNYNLVLEKPLWVDTDLSIWDRGVDPTRRHRVIHGDASDGRWRAAGRAYAPLAVASPPVRLAPRVGQDPRAGHLDVPTTLEQAHAVSVSLLENAAT
jgi:hypothetical protein